LPASFEESVYGKKRLNPETRGNATGLGLLFRISSQKIKSPGGATLPLRLGKVAEVQKRKGKPWTKKSLPSICACIAVYPLAGGKGSSPVSGKSHMGIKRGPKQKGGKAQRPIHCCGGICWGEGNDRGRRVVI